MKDSKQLIKEREQLIHKMLDEMEIPSGWSGHQEYSQSKYSIVERYFKKIDKRAEKRGRENLRQKCIESFRPRHFGFGIEYLDGPEIISRIENL